MALLHQRRRQMAKLARKILVNEEQAHGAICAGWTRCICPESFAECLICAAGWQVVEEGLGMAAQLLGNGGAWHLLHAAHPCQISSRSICSPG